MKKTIFSLLLLASSLTIKAQETKEIPLKNGMVYYTFSNKLNNTKKCLKNYVQELPAKILAKCSEVSTQKTRPFYGKNYSLMISAPMLLSQIKVCEDTAKMGMFMLSVPTKIKPTRLYNLNKQKIISQTIEAKIEIVFINKTEYILKLKGFTYKTISMSGYKSETSEHPLGEMYQAYLSDNDKSKAETNLYNDVNMMVNEVDRIIKECFTEVYKTDELD